METTEEMIKVMQAYADGKEIEWSFANGNNIWSASYNPAWNWAYCDYRVKEEPKFTYPMWFKSTKTNLVVRFDALQSGEVIIASKLWPKFHKSDYWNPHTDKRLWTQVEEPKKTKIVKEWIFKINYTWSIESELMTDEEATKYFIDYASEYKPTGREWEVEL